MASKNLVILIGRLGSDPEKRVTPAGHSVINISLATTERFKDQSGNKQEKSEWHKLVAWSQVADLIDQYCKKGSQLYVEGSSQTREWSDKDGNKRWTTEINVRNIQFLDSKGSTQSQGSYQQPSQQNQRPAASGSNYPKPENDDFIEDDVPF